MGLAVEVVAQPPGRVPCGAYHDLDRFGRHPPLLRIMRIATVIGNRPQFVKAAAVSRPLREHHEELIVNTGQHYDNERSRVFFEACAAPAREFELGIGDGAGRSQTWRMLKALEPVLTEM